MPYGFWLYMKIYSYSIWWVDEWIDCLLYIYKEIIDRDNKAWFQKQSVQLVFCFLSGLSEAENRVVDFKWRKMCQI